MLDLDIVFKLAVALALGFVLGSERQRAQLSRHEIDYMGARTYAILCVLGVLSGLVSAEYYPRFWAAALAAVMLLLAIGYYLTAIHQQDFGFTTEATALLTFILGLLIHGGRVRLSLAVGAAVLFLLFEKKSFAWIIKRAEDSDIRAVIKFAVITLIVLPLLPDRAVDPWGVLNPRQVWLFVILIAGISFAGYVLMRITGPRKGIGLTGVLGGVVSSTAVAVALSKRRREAAPRPLAFAILVASTMMLPRLLLVVTVVRPSPFRPLLVPLGTMTLAGLAGCLIFWRGSERKDEPEVPFANPFELLSAVKFGILFGAVLVATEGAKRYFGPAGLYAASAVSGLTGIDAISLTLAKMTGSGITVAAAALCVSVAAMSNTLSKLAIVYVVGGSRLFRAVLPPFLLILAGGVAGIAVGRMFLP